RTERELVARSERRLRGLDDEAGDLADDADAPGRVVRANAGEPIARLDQGAAVAERADLPGNGFDRDDRPVLRAPGDGVRDVTARRAVVEGRPCPERGRLTGTEDEVRRLDLDPLDLSHRDRQRRDQAA